MKAILSGFCVLVLLFLVLSRDQQRATPLSDAVTSQKSEPTDYDKFIQEWRPTYPEVAKRFNENLTVPEEAPTAKPVPPAIAETPKVEEAPPTEANFGYAPNFKPSVLEVCDVGPHKTGANIYVFSVDGKTDWCTNCTQEERDITGAGFTVGNEDEADFHVIVLYTKEDCKKRGIRGFPTTVFFKGGIEQGRFTGYKKGDLGKILRHSPNVHHRPLPRAESAYRSALYENPPKAPRAAPPAPGNEGTPLQPSVQPEAVAAPLAAVPSCAAPPPVGYAAPSCAAPAPMAAAPQTPMTTVTMVDCGRPDHPVLGTYQVPTQAPMTPSGAIGLSAYQAPNCSQPQSQQAYGGSLGPYIYPPQDFSGYGGNYGNQFSGVGGYGAPAYYGGSGFSGGSSCPGGVCPPRF